MKKQEQISAVVSEAVSDGKWITWSDFRNHLVCSDYAKTSGRSFDPFTFILVHRYLRYWVNRIEDALANDTITASTAKAEAINTFFRNTFLNHLLDCFWASYVVRDVISDLFEVCLRQRLDLGFGFKRYEYNKKGWERLENEFPDDPVEARWYDMIREFTNEFRTNIGLKSVILERDPATPNPRKQN